MGRKRQNLNQENQRTGSTTAIQKNKRDKKISKVEGSDDSMAAKKSMRVTHSKHTNNNDAVQGKQVENNNNNLKQLRKEEKEIVSVKTKVHIPQKNKKANTPTCRSEKFKIVKTGIKIGKFSAESNLESEVKMKKRKAVEQAKGIKTCSEAHIQTQKGKKVSSSQKVNSKTRSVDEIDGDEQTSEYFSSDSGVKKSTDERKRKKKGLEEKKSMCSKVKQLRISARCVNIQKKKTEGLQNIKSKDSDSSESDFEEGPDAKSPSVLQKNMEKDKDTVEPGPTEDISFMKKSTNLSRREKKEENKGDDNADKAEITNSSESSRLREPDAIKRESDGKLDEDETSDSDFEEVSDFKSLDVSNKILHMKKENDSHGNDNSKTKNVKCFEVKRIGKEEVNKDTDDMKSKPGRKRKLKAATKERLPAKRKKHDKKAFKVSKTQTEVLIKSETHDESKIDVEISMEANRKPENSAKQNAGTRKPKHKHVENKDELLKTVDHSDITALLLHMEGPCAVIKPSTSYAGDDQEVMSDDDSDDESEGDWEDVEDHHSHSPLKSQLPDKPVEITLEAPVIYKKRKKREFDIKAYFQKQINKYKRELNISMHKVHLLCLLSRGFYLNNICMDETLEALAMSISMLTRELQITSVLSCDVNGLSYMIKWMKEAFPLKTLGDNDSVDLICVILLRQLGFLTRLVMSLQPIPIRKVPKKEMNSGKKRSGNPAKIQKKIQDPEETDQKKSKTTQKGKTTQSLPREISKKTVKAKRNTGTKMKDDHEIMINENNKETKSAKKFVVTKKNVSNIEKETIKERKKNSKVNTGSVEDASNNRPKAKNKMRRSCASKLKPDIYVDNDNEMDDSEDEFVPGKYKSDDDDDSNGDSVGEEEDKRNKNWKGQTKKEVESSDDEFSDASFKLRTEALKKASPTQKNKKALSSDSGELAGSSSGADEWMEVFLQKEQKWVCVDCITGKLDKPYSVEHNATPPVHYIVGFNEDGTIKDVTARYASQWLTTTRKFRADEDWWSETMNLYKPSDRKMDEMENKEIQSHLLQRPLPTSIGAFKSHPLYALKRHLLKFEAIYPDTAVPLGYIRGEPVYARECVHVLHSRENWLKEGRAVRVGEEPYKHVKSRPKWNKPKENPDALDLELFGHWQTEVYIPPPAVDGKVPRNAHGNVELFLPSMLPAGTVHIQIEGLNKVAKKLSIDCAPAMVGWDHHCGFSHPRMDGWIVCEEFKDILLAAWDEEQEIIREKEQEKREKRVYSNWKLLIKGLLIKERLKKRFDLEEEDQTKAEKEALDDREAEKKEKAVDFKMSWPQNRQKQEQKHFDVEKL